MKFGRWTFVREVGRDAGKRLLWLCVCECGTEKVLFASNVKRGASKSCGCMRDELAVKRATKHGQKRSGAYRSWESMRQRCYYEKNISYARYGGRGISVCERWRDSFQNFYADMGDRPDGATLDRIDPNGDYEPGNCRWLPKAEQSRNRRDNRLYAFKGELLTVPEIASRIGMKENTLRRRVTAYGMSMDEAVARPVHARLYGIYPQMKEAA